MGIKSHPESCTGCPLEKIGRGFMTEEGTGSNGVLIVGEALGEAESIDSLPFRPYAQAGSILERVIRRMGRKREEFAISNLVYCRPPGNELQGTSYEEKAVEKCRENLLKAVEKFRPKVILALGNLPLRYLTGLKGKRMGVSSVRGYAVWSESLGLPVVSTYHPAFLARGKRGMMRVLENDINVALRVARGEQNVLKDPKEEYKNEYVLKGEYRNLQGLLMELNRNPELLLAVDIETPFSTKEESEDKVEESGERITQIQFSTGKGKAIVVDAAGLRDLRGILNQIFLTPNPKVAHNGRLFDWPRLRAEGFEINGECYDSMNMWHWWQPDLPKGLQYVAGFFGFPFPWKHMAGEDLAFYGACDVDALHYIAGPLVQRLKDEGMWQVRGGDKGTEVPLGGFYNHSHRMGSLLDRVTEHGVEVDDERRRRVGEELEKEMERVDREIQRLTMEYRKKEVYKALPREVHVWLKKWLEEVGLKVLGEKEFRKAMKKPSSVLMLEGSYGKEGARVDPAMVISFLSNATDGLCWDESIERFVKVHPFKPSNQQMKAYMRAKGHPVPKGIKKGENGKEEKETSDEKALLELSGKTGDPLYGEVLKLRGLQKMLSTYVKGFAPGKDGRIHPIYTFNPATGQLSTTASPPIQTVPKEGEFRKMITAGKERMLVAADFSGYHAQMTGFFAGDPTLFRVATMGAHDLLAAHIVRKAELWRALPEELRIEAEIRLAKLDEWTYLDDRKLKENLAFIRQNFKSVRNRQAKPAIHGSNFGMGLRKFYDMNRASFKSLKEAEEVFAILRRLFPDVYRWQENTKRNAYDKGYLVNPFGRRRLFPDALRWDSRTRELVNGEQAEECLAFLPSSTAFDHKFWIYLEMDRDEIFERWPMVIDVHDEIVLEVRKGEEEECARVVREYMTRRSPVLRGALCPEGLKAEVEIKAGRVWGEMKEFSR